MTTAVQRVLRLGGALGAGVALVVALACGGGEAPATPADASKSVADTIYHGGDIVTVSEQHPSAEALAVKDGRILRCARADVGRAQG